MVLVLEVEEVAAEAEALAVGVAGTHQSPFIAMCNGISSFISSMFVIHINIRIQDVPSACTHGLG